jgi:alpha-1,2-mannosyltransferase
MLLASLSSVALLVLLPSVAMYLLRAGHAFWPIEHWLKGEAGGDSWDPISNALAYVAAHGGKGLYEATYYRDPHQFLYPPTSLVFADLTGRLGLFDWHSSASMNHVSWWLVPVIMMAHASITVSFLARYVRKLSAIDLALAVMLGIATVSLFFPIMSGFTSGQIQTWLTLLLSLALLFWTFGRKVAAGTAVGLVCVIKPQLGVLVLWALLRKEWGFAGALTATCALFFLASLAIYGLDVQEEYIQLLSFLSHRGESYFQNQTVNGLLNRMLFIGNNIQWDGTHTKITYNIWVQVFTVINSAALMAFVILYRRRVAAGPLDLGLAFIGFTLASPVSYFHHFGFLATVFLLTLLELYARRAGGRPYAFLAVTFALCANRWGITDALANTPFNLLQSHLMFGALLLMILLVWINQTGDNASDHRSVVAVAR